MNEKLRDDLNLSHAFINSLSAAYQAAYVFEQALGYLGASNAEARADAVAERIDEINEWWDAFKRHEPLLGAGEELSAIGARAWELLSDARDRLEGLTIELKRGTDLESLFVDRSALSLRVVTFCEAAYSREHFVQGLVCYGDVMRMPDVSDRYRQRLPSCQQGVREAHGYLERAFRLRELPSAETEIAELLDATLTVPVLFAQRALDIRQVFSRYSGSFEFEHAGIEEADSAEWRRFGFPPYAAGQWMAAGLCAAEAYDWIRAGVPDALAAATYYWRDIELDVAADWYAAGLSGRKAAGWLDAGVDVDEASAWQARGVNYPEQRSRIA